MGTAEAVWPISLPRAPRLDTLAETFPSTVLRTQMDAGAAKARRRFTAGVRNFNVQFDMTRGQVGIFNDFFLNTIAGGALPYQWMNPRTGLIADYRIVGQPTAVPRSPRTNDEKDFWLVSFQVEELPGTTEVCEIQSITGDLGSFTFAKTSTLTVQLQARCFAGSSFLGSASVTRSFAWLQLEPELEDQVFWRFQNGDGASYIRFHADLGWSFIFIDAHYPVTACGGGATRIAPLSASELSFPYFRHYGWPEIVNGGLGNQSPSLLCPSAHTWSWFKAVDAGLNPACAPAPIERARGFRYYASVCSSVEPSGGGSPVDPSVEGEEPLVSDDGANWIGVVEGGE